MKVIHINTHDIVGGAARAAYRLHLGLQKAGLNSAMHVQEKQGSDRTVYGAESKVGKLLAKFWPYIDWFPAKYYKKESARGDKNP